MKNVIEIKQNTDIIAQDDILIKWTGTRNFLGKITSKTVTMVYFFMIWKIKTDLSFIWITEYE